MRCFCAALRLSVTWHPPGWPRPSTIHVRVIPSGGKAAIRVHQEHLPSAREREQMQRRWYAVLDQREALLAKRER